MSNIFTEKRTYTTISFVASAGAVIALPLNYSALILALEVDAVAAMMYSITKNYGTYLQIKALDNENQRLAALGHLRRINPINDVLHEALYYWRMNIVLNVSSILATILHGIFLELLATDAHSIHDPYVLAGTVIGTAAVVVYGATHLFSSREKRKILNTLKMEHANIIKQILSNKCQQPAPLLRVINDGIIDPNDSLKHVVVEQPTPRILNMFRAQHTMTLSEAEDNGYFEPSKLKRAMSIP